jgi:hypothetical protein
MCARKKCSLWEKLHFFTWMLDRYAVGSWKLDVYCCCATFIVRWTFIVAAQRLLSVGRLLLLRNVYLHAAGNKRRQAIHAL